MNDRTCFDDGCRCKRFGRWAAIVGELCVALLALARSGLAADPPRPANIIFILADDLGYGDLGCYGQKKIRTPRLDRMAREGMRFTDHYAGFMVCSPSRCALMTGKHMGHASVRNNGGSLKASDVTVAMLLQQAGYRTCMIGKWGLVGRPGHRGSPNRKGFDHFFGYDNQGFAHFYYPEFLWRNDQKVLYPENHHLRVNGHYKSDRGTYSHDEFTREALRWIRQNKDHPFFLYLPYCIPHAELTVPPDSLEPYLKLDWPEKPKTAGYCAQSRPNATYAGMVSRLDQSVGQILDLLDELGLSQHTLVLFSSDNGPSAEGGQSLDFFDSNGPFSGAKRSLREGGIRVPLIAWWPGHVPPGTVSHHVCAFWDFLPTACELAGIDPPEDIDGISFLPTLLGQPEKQPKHRYLYWIWAVRVGKWKLHVRGKDRYALYDLENDPAEQHDLADEFPDVVARCARYFEEATR